MRFADYQLLLTHSESCKIWPWGNPSTVTNLKSAEDFSNTPEQLKKLTVTQTKDLLLSGQEQIILSSDGCLRTVPM